MNREGDIMMPLRLSPINGLKVEHRLTRDDGIRSSKLIEPRTKKVKMRKKGCDYSFIRKFQDTINGIQLTINWDEKFFRSCIFLYK